MAVSLYIQHTLVHSFTHSTVCLPFIINRLAVIGVSEVTMAVGVGIVAIFVVVCFLMGYLFYRQMKLWYIMSKFPGPKAYPIIGNAYQFDTDPRGKLSYAFHF